MSLADEIRIETRHFIVHPSGVNMGPMFDFYSGAADVPPSVLRNPYPFKRGQIGVETMEEAEAMLAKVRNHIQAVVALPANQKKGSSKFWK